MGRCGDRIDVVLAVRPEWGVHTVFSPVPGIMNAMVDGGNDYDGKWIEMFQVVVSSMFFSSLPGEMIQFD